jgi:hypothetical protein
LSAWVSAELSRSGLLGFNKPHCWNIVRKGHANPEVRRDPYRRAGLLAAPAEAVMRYLRQ